MKKKSLIKQAALFLGILLVSQCTPKKSDTAYTKVAYIHPYGVELQDEEDFAAHGGTGEVIHKLSNGVVVTDKFKDGKFHGKLYETFPHQEIYARVREYEDGILLSETENTTSGTPKEKRYFYNGNVTNYTCWYEDGSPQADENFINNLLVEGKYYSSDHDIESEIHLGTGIKVKRDNLGLLTGKEFFKNSVLTNEDKYYPNGAIQSKLPFANGKINGVVKTFFPGGEPKTTEEWVEGQPHGITLSYQNGECVAKTPYYNGIKQGIELKFIPGTQHIISEVRWENNKRQGQAITYTPDGEKISEWFFNNQKVSKHKYNELTH